MMTEPIRFMPTYFFSICIIAGICFVIDWWTVEIVLGSSIPLEIMGYVFTGIAFSIHFVEHVIKVLLTVYDS
jgi:hypothetical protein